MVKTLQYLYEVDTANTRHHVTKTRRCLEHGDECPAIYSVSAYLKAGGERCATTPEPFTDADLLSSCEKDAPDTYWYMPPPKCPVCDAEVKIESRYLSGGHDTFWQCRAAGRLHFWQAKANVLIGLQKANPRTELYPGLTLRACDEFREMNKDRRYVDSDREGEKVDDHKA